MALATELVGDGKIINREKTGPVMLQTFGIGLSTQLWTLEIETERREWYALTYAAANAAVTANVQPDPPGNIVYNWSMDIVNNAVNGYMVIRMSDEKIYTLVPEPVPEA